MVTVPSEPGTGIGYSPPARKLAVSPDSATKLGSARLRIRPFCSRALMATSTEKFPPVHRSKQKTERGDTREQSRCGNGRDRRVICGDMGPAELGARRGEGRLLKRPARRGHRQLVGEHPVADIGERVLAEAVPLHPELAARLPRGLDEAHLQHHLLRL